MLIKNLKTILIIICIFVNYSFATDTTDYDSLSHKSSTRSVKGKKKNTRHTQQVRKEEKSKSANSTFFTPFRTGCLFAFCCVTGGYAWKSYFSGPSSGEAVSTVDESYMPTKGLFSEIEKEIFQQKQAELFAQPILETNDTAITRDTFDKITNRLSNHRNEIATLAKNPESFYFGQKKDEKKSLRSVTTIMSHENPALYDLWTQRIHVLIKKPELTAPGEEVIVRGAEDLLKNPHTVEVSILRKQLGYIPDSKKIKIANLLLEGQLGQLALGQHVRINNTYVPISSIFGFIRLASKVTDPISLSDYDSYSSYTIHHAPLASANQLIDASYLDWFKAMQTNPKIFPVEFLEYIGRVFWLQSQAMQYIRGSEAITKWLVELTARYHHYTLIYPKGYEFRLPFAMTLNDFVSDFKKEIHLEPLGL